MPTTRPVVAPAPAFEELYTKYRSSFVRVAVSYVQNRMVAEDIVSDCFVSYWENRSGAVVENVPAYVLTAVKNRCLDWLRRRVKQSQAHQNMLCVESRLRSHDIASLEANIPRSLLLSEVSEIIRMELNRMPERMRKVYVAHKFSDMSYKEIGQLYGLSQGQVLSDIRTASHHLRAALKDYSPLLLLLPLLH